MPSYNTGKFIAESIRSVISQTYTNWELLIVDDCSQDNTDEIVKPFLNDDRIKYFKNAKNIGTALTRNRALNEAKGEYIAFLDSDDLWLEDKLESQINFMERNSCSFSYTKYELIDEDSKLLGRLISGPKYITRKGMHHYSWPGCLTVMCKLHKGGGGG